MAELLATAVAVAALGDAEAKLLVPIVVAALGDGLDDVVFIVSMTETGAGQWIAWSGVRRLQGDPWSASRSLPRADV